jgi:hypothetical protein
MQWKQCSYPHSSLEQLILANRELEQLIEDELEALIREALPLEELP